MSHQKIILASSSPRRKMLLRKIVDKFVIVKPKVQEVNLVDPQENALSNAIIKGKSITDDAFCIIACDTLVSLNGTIYGKPYTKQQAIKTLKILSGETHSVFSGVYIKIAGKEYSFTQESKVKLRKLTREDIVNYVDEYLPLDKAGAYGIQDDVIVESYLGSYDNIVGFPTDKIREIIREYMDVKD